MYLIRLTKLRGGHTMYYGKPPFLWIRDPKKARVFKECRIAKHIIQRDFSYSDRAHVIPLHEVEWY